MQFLICMYIWCSLLVYRNVVHIGVHNDNYINNNSNNSINESYPIKYYIII